MGKNKKLKSGKGNVFKVAGAKSLKKTKSKAVNLGLKNEITRSRSSSPPPQRKKKYVKRTTRPYINYTKETLMECIASVKSKQLTQREASEYYEIPRSTIKIKLIKPESLKPGRQFTFSEEEESMFVSHFIALTNYGFPVTNFDIKMFIRDYLLAQNRIVRIFRNNVPGKDWLKFFLERHEELNNRIIKYKNSLTQAIVTEFIDTVANEIAELPPENVYCYEEVGFCDDIRKYAVGRRGTKYPENNKQASKPSFSAMFCGNAAGETVPPFVTYKSDHLSTAWTFNGPKGARYCCTEHGWIDIVTFEDWFLNHALPVLKNKAGRKLLIGDSLSSHISLDIMSECEENDIHFMCLPFNSSHILQPLDVAYFQPLRPTWKKILSEWKETPIGKRLETVPKTEFPALLKKALNILLECGHNLIIGFKNTGIYPTNVQEPFARLPRQERIIDTQFMKMRKMLMPRSICPSDDNKEYIEDLEDETMLTDTNEYPVNIKEEAPDISDLATLQVDLPNDAYLVVVKNGEVYQIPFDQDESDNHLNIAVGDHVIVTTKRSHFPGRVLTLCPDGAFVTCMEKKQVFWSWPKATRIRLFTWDKILCKIDAPKFLRNGSFFVPEIVGLEIKEERVGDYEENDDEQIDELEYDYVHDNEDDEDTDMQENENDEDNAECGNEENEETYLQLNEDDDDDEHGSEDDGINYMQVNEYDEDTDEHENEEGEVNDEHENEDEEVNDEHENEDEEVNDEHRSKDVDNHAQSNDDEGNSAEEILAEEQEDGNKEGHNDDVNESSQVSKDVEEK